MNLTFLLILYCLSLLSIFPSCILSTSLSAFSPPELSDPPPPILLDYVGVWDYLCYDFSPDEFIVAVSRGMSCSEMRIPPLRYQVEDSSTHTPAVHQKESSRVRLEYMLGEQIHHLSQRYSEYRTEVELLKKELLPP